MFYKGCSDFGGSSWIPPINYILGPILGNSIDINTRGRFFDVHKTIVRPKRKGPAFHNFPSFPEPSQPARRPPGLLPGRPDPD